MTRTKQVALLALGAGVGGGLLAFTHAKDKAEAAAPTARASAPSYALPDQDGRMHTSKDDKGKVVLLAFYPADFTGGCTLEAHALSSAYPRLKAEGVTVYGVSVQDPKSHKAFCSKEGIPYTLLADTEKKAATAYGVLIPGVGIADRVTYIVGADGKVAYVDKNVNGHLTTCGADWADWIAAHPVATGSASESTPVRRASLAQSRVTVRVATVSKPAPDFSLPDVTTGGKDSLVSLGHGKKATVLMFISTRCPVSNAYNERMTALANKYNAQGVAFVGIDSDQNEPTPEIAAFTKDKGFPFPVLKDDGPHVADAYAAHVTPETYVIDSKGVLVYHGRIDNDMDPSSAKTHELADALDATLAGQPVVKAQTKAFGCSIKR